MTEYCPRAIENGGGPNSPFKPPMNGEMHWRDDRTCSYCGSLHPDDFLRVVEEGSQLTPTDKSYKAYIDLPHPKAGQMQVVQSRNFAPEPHEEGWIEATPQVCEQYGIEPWAADNLHWVKPSVAPSTKTGKFYFQHLSKEQQDKLIELNNTKKINFGAPGGFYVKPYFCAVVVDP